MTATKTAGNRAISALRNAPACPRDVDRRGREGVVLVDRVVLDLALGEDVRAEVLVVGDEVPTPAAQHS